MNLCLPAGIVEILSVFDRASIETWLVGGCVRDGLLGCPPKDFDLTTAAAPEQVQVLFPNTVPTGLRFGTVTVFCQDVQAEVTTFRKEMGTRDARHPARVIFGVSLRDDLARRDFTVNAMAWHPARGLFDPFDGEADLHAGLVRAVGEPHLRFTEDALRILRAYRFAAQLGFVIEPRTRAAAIDAMPRMAALSGERIREEWEKLLCSASPAMAFLPELAGVWRAIGLPVNSVSPPERLAELPARPAVRWAAFVYLSQVEAQRLFCRLHMANRLADEICMLVSVLTDRLPDDALSLKKRLGRIAPPLLEEGLRMRALLKGEDTRPVRERLEGILRRGEPYRPEHLALRGGELAAMGWVGAACGHAQRALLTYVLQYPGKNTPDALRAYLLRNIRNLR